MSKVSDIKPAVKARYAGRGKLLREALSLVALLSAETLTVEQIALRTGMQWRRVYRLLDDLRTAGIGLHETERAQRARGTNPSAYHIPAAEMVRVFGSRPSVDVVTPESVHEAMQAAPHDGRPYRQARAAIAAITRA